MTSQAISELPRSNVLGVGISAINMCMATEHIFRGVDVPYSTGYITVTGVHGVIASQSDVELKRIHNRSFLSTPDGMPLVWLGRWNGFSYMDRVYGPDLMLETLRRSEKHGHKHYLFGGAAGVVGTLATKLHSRFPGVNFVGTRTPQFKPWTEHEEEELVMDLIKTKPHFFWVGLSTPKQERFMHDFLYRNSDRIKNRSHGMLMIGVGAAFDFHARLKKQAPRWIQRSGMEWAFRLSQEPRRLWRRYWQNNTRFIRLIGSQLAGKKKYDMPM